MPRALNLPPLLDYLETRLGNAKPTSGEYQFHCPACAERTGSESADPKLWVNLEGGKGICYRCDFKFRDWEYLFKQLNNGIVTIQELALIAREARLPVDSLRDHVVSLFDTVAARTEAKVLKPVPLPPGFRSFADGDPTKLPLRPAAQYLARRGIALSRAIQFGVGYCDSGPRGGHLIFPVTMGGKVVYWTTRNIGNGPKTNNPGNADGYVSKNECLLNYDRVLGQKQVQIVEGPFDCMAHASGLALLGKTLSSTQIALIEALVPYGLEEVIVSLDPDAGREIDRIYSRLLGRIPSVRTLYLDGGDPHDLREQLPVLVPLAREPSVLDRVRSRLAHKG